MLVNLELSQKKVLVVGGGRVALRKTKKLLKYDCLITLISPSYLPEFDNLDLKILKDNFSFDIIEDFNLIFLCTDNDNLHNEIIEYCKDKKILINNSTSQTNMDFAMAASFDYDDYEIAVTSNKGVSTNKKFKEDLKKLLEKE